LPTPKVRTLHNPRVTILSRAGLILAATLLAAACAPAGAPSTTGPSAPATTGGQACTKGALPTVAAGTLTVGTDQPVYQPWYVDDAPENGQGFESAVAYAIADQLGYPKDKVAWTRVPFNAAIQPGPKPFDLNLTEFSITDERKQAVDFSAPYYDVKQAVVALSDNPFAGSTNLSRLAGARLGAQVGTTSYDAINAVIKPTTPASVFNTNDDAKLALSNGQVDAIVVDLPTAFYITSAELQNAKIVGQLPAGTGTPEQFGAVLDKGSPLTSCVSEAVDALRSAGTLTALEKQWLTAAGSAPELT
jgi:polar amino acid transport system substrate-binding protein